MIIVHKIGNGRNTENIPEGWGNSYPVSIAPWAGYNYLPNVRFRIAYAEKSILLKILVKERYIRAKYTHPNDPVYRDSCFEFFISPDNDLSYYNFEFNCIGTTYLAFGTRSNRKLASHDTVRSITAVSSLGTEPFGEKEGMHEWEMDINIPLTAFFKHSLDSLDGNSMKANFYKCGDELSQAHFLCWQNIISAEPDFHRPEFFGELLFE